MKEHCPGMQNVHLRFSSVGEKRRLQRILIFLLKVGLIIAFLSFIILFDAFVTRLAFCFSHVLTGTDDEDADNEIRQFAVMSYMDLLEKPVLPDILVRVICWVSKTA